MGIFDRFRKKKKDRKPFRDTRFGRFLKKAGDKIPDLAGDIFEIATSANPIGASIGLIKDKLEERKDKAETAEKAVINALLAEIERDKAEWEHEANMYEIAVADRDSARKMQIAALGQDDRFAKRFVYYLASFIIASATIFGVLLFFIDVPEANKRLVEMFADIYLFAGAIMIIQFFFGSSHGSKAKDEQLKKKEDSPVGKIE